LGLVGSPKMDPRTTLSRARPTTRGRDVPAGRALQQQLDVFTDGALKPRRLVTIETIASFTLGMTPARLEDT